MMRIHKIYYSVIIPIIFIGILIFSAYESKKAVQIYLPSLFPEKEIHFDTSNFIGTPYIINVFNSWCSSCREEHHIWLTVIDEIKLYGINYVDNKEQAQKFLEDNGNPYLITAFDKRGISAQELNISALPTTVIIDKFGKIQYHITGAVTQDKLTHEILPLYKQLMN